MSSSWKWLLFVATLCVCSVGCGPGVDDTPVTAEELSAQEAEAEAEEAAETAQSQ